ncbi:sulfurtransferase TusA family protein [Nosocomiicoccus ampullae]|uniref:TusA-related sulfurtransferase n=1 Tax=Nosocomiicoccus ampullae TaxID=489910 RepID=A0A9Q2D1F7_9STAP|nr:sulfurtransferase TusA family protein [Nosocomiicoccus ampullae]MBB5176655.1 TusA-related sulfurtransferase [Nosocomiicoccus ampullae]QYA46579.1 sulfurtransferase TusA family protein [Nosocomiicoccus ampullae]QYA48164.1 sulfurtransferase TusA family protein [Nosocomiicoccus ampullae]HJB78664.1 sulfurtransferase TusA family protein [Candidatus Nosocomiicoccus stercorigallinarum]
MVYELGTVGMVCPFPLIEAQKKMETLDIGDALKIDFDCTQATEALPNWAAENNYNVTEFEQLDDASWTITIEKV